jgi:hypothetical protein
MNNWLDKPSLMSFEDALHKGFGRTYIWTKAGHANTTQLIDACLNDYRFDRQVEDARGDWLWRIAKASSNYDTIRNCVMDALDNVSNSDAESQLCQLAAHFAEEGDDRFRMRLRTIVEEKPVEEMQFLGERELMRLDGDEGFLLALRRHAADLRTREWDWFDAALVDEAREILGELHVSNLLRELSATDDDIRVFTEALHHESSRTPYDGSAAYRQELASLTVDEIIAAAESSQKARAHFRGWGRQAKSSDLERILERLLDSTNAEVIDKYLQVFAMRALPRFDSRILELCQHESLQVRRRAARAVANNKHSEVRKFAVSKLGDPEYQKYAIEMLAKNYERGDEHTVLEAIVLPNESDQRHWMLMSLLKMIEENSEAECSRPAKLIYAESPCSQCRYSTVRLLENREVLPDEIRTECRFDVQPDTRALVDGPAWN